MLRFGFLLIALWCASTTGCNTLNEHAKPDGVLRAHVYIEADYNAVWRRFTQAEAYTDWYSAPCREFGAQPGERVEWGDPERVFYTGELLSIEKGRGLAHSFRFVGFGFEEPETRVEIDIREQGETVLVSIRHDCREAPNTYDLIRPVGWPKSLSRLKTLLETGTPMPWPDES